MRLHSSSESSGSENRFLDTARRLLVSAQADAYLITPDRSWVFPLMVTIVSTLRRGVRISVLYFPPTAEDANANRLNLLRNIGCSVAVREANETAPFTGVIVDPMGPEPAQMVVRTPSLANVGIQSRWYSGPNHQDTVQQHFHSVRREFKRDPTPFIPELQSVSVAELVRILNTKSRFYQALQPSFEEVVVRQALPQEIFVKAYKLNQIATLDEMLLASQLELYEPVVATLRNGRYTPILPPVVEMHPNRGPIIIEGHSRFYRAIEQQRVTLRALVFRGVTVATPSSPREWTDVRLFHDDPPELVHNDRTLARYVERDARDAAEWI